LDRFRALTARTTLFYRILIASSAIVLIGAVVGTWVVRALPEQFPLDLIAGFVLGGVSLHVIANFWILKAAMKPLESLQRTVDEVYYRDNLKARAEPEPMGDPATNRLAEALNSMLERLQANQSELQRLPARVLGAQEEERKRIARELHDETSQALTSVIVGLKALEKPGRQCEIQDRVAELRATVAETLEAVHRMAVELRPSALDELGLLPALRGYAKEYSRQHGIQVGLQVSGLKGRLPSEVEVAIYRVVQEALTNAAKYSEASQVAVKLSVEGSTLTATVRDQGRGFDLNRVQQSKDGGLGLFGMRERVSLLSGQLEILSAPRAGTTIVARVPLGGVAEKVKG
ncbi:MAG: histidine kinase, partial [Chloroflexi bacterium]|nr:histidine kinase [Chloroflexota bacterium]